MDALASFHLDVANAPFPRPFATTANTVMSHEQPHWPGDREPSPRDVEVANELPEPAFLSTFRSALLASVDGKGNERLLNRDLSSNLMHRPKEFTYPLALFADFPALPTDVVFANERKTAAEACATHPFLRCLPLPSASAEAVSFPLRLAMACIASVSADPAQSDARTLYLAGTSLWAVILEVDNREARSLEAWTAAVLLTTYGVLSRDGDTRERASFFACFVVTITRRMRFHQLRSARDTSTLPFCSFSSLVGCAWLNDVINALVSNVALNFSSYELDASMPASSGRFSDTYRNLLHAPDPYAPPPVDCASKLIYEDALFLLIAVISDLIALQRSLGRVVMAENGRSSCVDEYNPFIPLSPRTELERMTRVLSRGLDRWLARYQQAVTNEILALYNYCRLYISCPDLLILPRIGGYYDTASTPPSPPNISMVLPPISEESVSYAWLVLENAASRSSSSGVLCSAWLPVAVFHASLVVWAKQSPGMAADGQQSGRQRALLAFKMELESMPWPCCIDMAALLGRLMLS